MTDLLQQKDIFEKQLVHYKVQIPFVSMRPNLEEHFLEYAENNIVDQCEKEGYVSSDGFRVISYSAGKTIQSSVEYDVLYEFRICYPYENMTFQCVVQSITKIGVKGILSNDEQENPIIVFASQLHNPILFEKDFAVGDLIQVKVISYRFEIHDPSIYVLGEII